MEQPRMDRNDVSSTVARQPLTWGIRDGWTGSAVFSKNGKYRYVLTRTQETAPSLFVKPRTGYVAWVMLNPSTASGEDDDPTVRRCMNFTTRLGYARLAVVNLFAFRTAYPSVLHREPHPVGPANDEYLRKIAKDAEVVVCAWGTGGTFRKRSAAVLDLFAGVSLRCLGHSKTGEPLHPLYLPADTQLVPYAEEIGLDR